MGVDLTDRCVLQYKMNDNAANTTVTDTSGEGNTGTSARNTSIITAAGKINTCLEFDDAESDEVNLTTPIVLNGAVKQWVIAFFTKHDDNRAGRPSILCGNDATNYLQMIDDLAGNRSMEFYSVGAPATWTGLPLFYQTWRFIVFRSSGANDVELLIDNVSKGTRTETPGLTINGIGLGASGAQMLKGFMDNFMVFDGGLSSEELDFLWNSGPGTELLASPSIARPLVGGSLVGRTLTGKGIIG